MSQVSLGRPEFVPGTPPGHPTAKFLYVIFIYRFFSLHIPLPQQMFMCLFWPLMFSCSFRAPPWQPQKKKKTRPEIQGAPKGRQQKGETGPATHIFTDFR